jgi:hypothetical protein
LLPGWILLTLLWLVAMALVVTGEVDREGRPAVRVDGAPQTVFDWSTSACEPTDYPDLPTRVFRNARGQTVLVVSHFVNRRMIGPDPNHLRHLCAPTMQSAQNPDPAAFADHEWIASTYTEDGKTVFALVHDEYQGHLHTGRCPSLVYLKCWYNAITLARSADGGATFVHAAEPPAHLVASSPYTYTPDVGPYGLFSPSNIVFRRSDGHFYTFVYAVKYQAQQLGSCLLRTQDLSDARSWRAWDGRGFSVQFASAYDKPPPDPRRHVCHPVAFDQLGVMTPSSLTYNTYLDEYVLVGTNTAYDPRSRRARSGVYYSLSSDLLNWSPRRLLLESELVETYQCGDRDPLQYPSILDPESNSRNFETVGRRAYLYYTQHRYQNCQPSSNRDLMRVPVNFTR